MPHRLSPGTASGRTLSLTQEQLLQDLDRHIRSPVLRRVYRNWRNILLSAPQLPSVANFEFGDDLISDHTFLAAVDDGGFRFVSVGNALTERLGKPLAGTVVADDAVEMFGSLKASYRACVEKEVPAYEYVRYAFGDGAPLLFERLIMPLFDPGNRVTHLTGAVLFTEIGTTH